MTGSDALSVVSMLSAWRWVALSLAVSLAGCGEASPPAGRTEPSPSGEPPQQALHSPAHEGKAADEASVVTALAAEPTITTTARGPALYTQHCAACHGEQGDGHGLAERYLYPKPRDFRAGRFRLISTVNGVPSLEDLESVLTRGLPGSSMVSWEHLSPADRRLLAEHVLLLRREGAADVERQLAADAEEELTADDLAARVASVTTPGEVLERAELGPSNAETIATGKELYASKGCAACHGATGKGDGQQQMVDGEGFATRPRDLTLGIFKGNHDPLSVYRRLRLGLPGSPMPASSLTDLELGAMVHYVLSLSDEATRESHVLRRRELLATRLPRAPQLADDEAWSNVASVPISVTPLWWRDGAVSNVAVQAAHDGRELVLRLTWNDGTPNDRATRADEFEDMVAVELYQGSAEPFLGMGAKGAALDLWQWRGGAHQTGAEDSQFDEYPFDTAIYQELAHGRPLPDFITARVAGNPLAQHDREASAMVAAGFGTTTFRPKASQLVVGEGKWHDGRWTVVVRRPLDVASDAGLPLVVGGDYSIALAVWDGAARDRGPQKLISMWNDLRVK